MKRFVTAGLLIGVLFFYGSYTLISGSDKNTGIANAPDGKDFIRTYKLLDNGNNNGIITNNEINSKEILTKENDKNNDSDENKVTIISSNNGSNVNGDEDYSNKVNDDNSNKELREEVVEVDSVNNNPAAAASEKIMDKEPAIVEKASTKTSEVGSPVKKVSLVEKIFIHRVKKGESLWEIANKYGIDIDTLIGANDITNMNTIQIGDQIKILPVKGVLYKINPGESLWTISRRFDVSIDKIAEANVLVNPDLVKPGMSLVLPGAKPEFGYKDRLSKKFIYPINSRISSYYGTRWGKMHEGIDFAVNTGTEVRAARSGKVVYSQWASGYGYTVVIEHQKGVRTLYAHNSKLLVYGGQWVERGQVISLSGNTGRSTGPHLHFEIQINGKPVNPMNYIQ